MDNWMAQNQKESLAGMGGTLSPSTYPHQPTMTENLSQRKAHLEDRLSRVNAALDALKQNPSFEEVLNLIQKAYY